MRSALLICLLLSSLFSYAQENCDDETPKALKPISDVVSAAYVNQCPNKDKLKHLCMMISSRKEDDNGTYEYEYQKSLAEAGCVSPNDTEASIKQKMQKAFDKYQDTIKCSGPSFDVLDGSVLKYAVSELFDDFIDDIISYKVDLNRVDPSDRRTVLDYVKYHVDINKGKTIANKYQSYYDKLRKAGAKHRVEL